MTQDNDIGNKDLQMVHTFLKKIYKEYLTTHKELDEETRLRWAHALQTVGAIGYQYKVERMTDKFVKGKDWKAMEEELINIIHLMGQRGKQGIENDTFDFQRALTILQNGGNVSRKGWNGKGMYLELMKPGGGVMTEEYIYITTNGEKVPWVASQTDLLSNDWISVFGV